MKAGPGATAYAVDGGERIDTPNCVRFEERGLLQGAVTIRELVEHALRHRSDHIVVGEVRGGEAADLLQALNTGHGGSLTTVHTNNTESGLLRLTNCVIQSGGDLPWDVTCRGVVDGIAMVMHTTRADDRRFVEEAAYVRGYDAVATHGPSNDSTASPSSGARHRAVRGRPGGPRGARPARRRIENVTPGEATMKRNQKRPKRIDQSWVREAQTYADLDDVAERSLAALVA